MAGGWRWDGGGGGDVIRFEIQSRQNITHLLSRWHKEKVMNDKAGFISTVNMIELAMQIIDESLTLLIIGELISCNFLSENLNFTMKNICKEHIISQLNNVEVQCDQFLTLGDSKNTLYIYSLILSRLLLGHIATTFFLSSLKETCSRFITVISAL